MKCLLQIRTSKTQADQNNHSIKTFSLIIFAVKFSAIRFNLFNLILARPFLIIGCFDYQISRLKPYIMGVQ